jgi:hypothetical protein
VTGRSPHQRRVARWVRGRHRHEPSGRQRELAKAAPKALLDLPGDRERRRQAEASRDVARREPPRPLEQGQRVAMRLPDQAVADLGIERDRQHRPKQGGGIPVGEAIDDQLGQPAQVRRDVTCAEQDAERFDEQAPDGEGHGVSRRQVEPVRVVDDDEHRRVLRGLGE